MDPIRPTLWLHGTRIGAATNSSSSHSILIFKPGAQLPADTDDLADQEYGWDRFVAASREAKLGWLGQIVRQAFLRSTRLYNDDPVLSLFTGGEKQEEARGAAAASALVEVPISPDGSVDHDSAPILGLIRDGRFSPAFAREFAAFLADPRVVIVGGNDNEGPVGVGVLAHPHRKDVVGKWDWLHRLPEEGGEEEAVQWRRDERDGYWSVYLKEGVTLRFRLAADPGPAIVRSEVPELLDVNLTDWCDRGCRYCYRGSTPEGQHADFSWTSSLLRAAHSLGVREVAFGGGEPLSFTSGDNKYPVGIKHLPGHALGIDYRVTTRRLDWLDADEGKAADFRRSILTSVGAFGVSVDTLAEAKRAVEAFSRRDILDRLTLHLVIGAVPVETLYAVIEYAHLRYVRVLLLDWKDTGRGAGGPLHPTDDSTLVDLVRAKHRVAIDTPLAGRLESRLLEASAWRGSFTTQEGGFSAFVDAVTRTLHSCSYDRSPGIPIPTTKYGDVAPEALQAVYLEMQAAVEGAAAP